MSSGLRPRRRAALRSCVASMDMSPRLSVSPRRTTGCCLKRGTRSARSPTMGTRSRKIGGRSCSGRGNLGIGSMTWESIRCRPDGSCPASHRRQWARSPLSGYVFPGSAHGLRLERKLERKMQWEDHEHYLAGLTKVLERASAKRLIVMGDFNQNYRARQPRTASTEIGASGGLSTKHDNRDLNACLPGTQKHRPYCTECGLGSWLPGSDQQHSRGEETVRPFRRFRRLVCPALPVAVWLFL